MTEPEEQIEKDKAQLRHLQEEIDEVRAKTPDEKAATEAHFVDRGTVGTEYTDDTIAPPG